MQTIAAFLASLGPWAWIIAGIVLLSLETVVPGVHLLWFGLAAAVIGVLTLALSGLGVSFDWPYQVVQFAILSVATVFFVRRWLQTGIAASDLPDLNARAAQYVGRTFTVAEAIAGGRGKVKVGDTLWQVEGPDLPLGAHVRVTATHGTILVVEPTTA